MMDQIFDLRSLEDGLAQVDGEAGLVNRDPRDRQLDDAGKGRKLNYSPST